MKLKPFLTSFTEDAAHLILKAGEIGLGIGALRVYALLHLSPTPVTRHALAAQLAVTPEAVSAGLRQLTERGLALKCDEVEMHGNGRNVNLYRAVKGEPV